MSQSRSQSYDKSFSVLQSEAAVWLKPRQHFVNTAVNLLRFSYLEKKHVQYSVRAVKCNLPAVPF